MIPLAEFWPLLDRRPLMIAIAGPNGAGKSTFFYSLLQVSGLDFVNADELAKEHGMDAYEAAAMAESLRQEMFIERASFVFETVFSDPVGEKVAFLRQAAASGYTVVLCFIGVDSALTSEERVALRVTRGGHDVPVNKLVERYPRILANLKTALRDLPYVLVFDNGDLRTPYRPVGVFENGHAAWVAGDIPEWLAESL